MSPLTALHLPLLAIVCGLYSQIHGAQNLYKMKHMMGSAQEGDNQRVYETKFFNVKVDHFSFTNGNTFPLKYLINKQHWIPERGPIFFYTGNEDRIENFCKSAGFMWETAEEFHAALVFAEHRYYGDSLPFGLNMVETSDNMAYLTVEQALLDFVQLVWFLWNENNVDGACKGLNPGPNPVIAFGGSYGGMLAAWIRMKYPNTFQGAIASSAPVLGFAGMTDCNSVTKITSSVYMAASSECGKTILASWNAIECVAQTEDGLQWLSKNWKLCCPLGKDDIQILENWLLSAYINMAMVNYPYPNNSIMPLPGYPVQKLCDLLKNDKDDKKLLLSVFNGINVYFNYTGTSKCLNINSDYESSSDSIAWDYQTCNEIILPECSDGINDIFPIYSWDPEANAQYCLDNYHVHSDNTTMEKTYGGRNLYAASNIMFSNGDNDPWYGEGVLTSISDTVRAVLIQGAAHHMDLMGSNVNDPKSVVDARNIHKSLINQWINEFHEQSNNK